MFMARLCPKISKIENANINLLYFVTFVLYIQGGWILYFGESFSVSMDMVIDFWKIVFNYHGMKKS